MTAAITPEQRSALSVADDGPITLIDRVLQRKYVLLPARLYARMVDELVAHGVDPMRLVERD